MNKRAVSPTILHRRPPRSRAAAPEAWAALREELSLREEEAFSDTKLALEEAIQSSAELEEFSEHLKIDMTEEGLRIQIIDQEGRSMFLSGSARPQQRMRKLIAEIATITGPLPNTIERTRAVAPSPVPESILISSFRLSARRIPIRCPLRIPINLRTGVLASCSSAKSQCCLRNSGKTGKGPLIAPLEMCPAQL